MPGKAGKPQISRANECAAQAEGRAPTGRKKTGILRNGNLVADFGRAAVSKHAAGRAGAVHATYTAESDCRLAPDTMTQRFSPAEPRARPQVSSPENVATRMPPFAPAIRSEEALPDASSVDRWGIRPLAIPATEASTLSFDGSSGLWPPLAYGPPVGHIVVCAVAKS